MEFKKLTPTPVMVHGSGTKYLVPGGTSGEIIVEQNEKIILFCTHGFTITTHRRLDAKCIGKNMYEIVNVQNLGHHEITDFLCTKLPDHSPVKTPNGCNNKKNLKIEIGYKVEGLNFLPLMEICHDEEEMRTHYTKFLLHPYNYIFQFDEDRPKFSKSIFFGKFGIEYSYTQASQIAKLNELIGVEKTTELVDVENNKYFSRGHLMAKVDLIFAVLQRSTFYHVNAAPQWQAINMKNWELTESTLRVFVAEEGITVEVITGTVGVLKLPNAKGTPTEIYLGVRKNPVPLLFYKLVINRAKKSGVVFLSLNHPKATPQDMVDMLSQYCTDVSHQLNWIKFKQNPRNGYMAACIPEQFSANVPHLPSGIGHGITNLLQVTAA